MTENQEQALIFEWAGLNERRHPELKLLHAIPNGGYRPPKTAAILKRTGVKAGVPDICLPVSRGGWNALYIELKRTKGGVVSAEQKVWLERLKSYGNKAIVCRGWEAARDEILHYLDERVRATKARAAPD